MHLWCAVFCYESVSSVRVEVILVWSPTLACVLFCPAQQDDFCLFATHPQCKRSRISKICVLDNKKKSFKFLVWFHDNNWDWDKVLKLSQNCFCSTILSAGTHVAGIFLSLLCETVARSDHCREASFPPLLLEVLGVGNLQNNEELSSSF